MKVAVGSTGVESIKRYQATRLIDYQGNKATWITTRNRPKRDDELLAGGSLYWILKGKFLAHQKILGLESDITEEGKKFCRIFLDPTFHVTAPKPQRGFQGWRYLQPENTPSDLDDGESVVGFGEIPQEMIKDLQNMGLI